MACTREEATKVTIQLPQAGVLSSKPMSFQTASSSTSDSPWNGVSITSSSQVDCYLIGIYTPESHGNKCMKKSDGSLAFEFGRYEGAIPAGSTITISNLTPGPSRTIYLLGMDAESGYCTSFKGSGPTPDKISYPRVLASTTLELLPGDNNVTLSVPTDLSSTVEIDECEVTDILFEDNPKVSLYGNERDGTLSLNTGTTFVTGNSGVRLNNASFSYTANPNSPTVIPSTKYFSANMQVRSVDTSTGTILTLGDVSPGDDFGTDHFNVGDEVLWHVSQGDHASLSPDDNACGTGLYRGRFEYDKIVAINTTNQTITLSRAISSSPSSINNTALTATALKGSTHCRIQVLRVPSFKELIVSTAAELNPPAYDADTGVGGILAFRTRKITLNTNFTLATEGFGYVSVTGNEGGSPEGPTGAASPGVSASGAGGGAYNSVGGGGGHAGVGGDAYNAGAGGGATIGYCSGSPCLPISDKKTYFGGSGGGTTSAGGNGGGILLLHAYEVSGTYDLYLNSNGGDAPVTTDSGAGAGGAIHFTNTIYSSSSDLVMNANGGAGDGQGGGGGGGVIEMTSCSLTSTPMSVTTNVNGGAGGGGGSPGNAGSNGLSSSTSPTDLCF